MSSYTHTRFLLSALTLSQLPPDQGAEVALAGRSNAGKSSVLNAMTGVSNLARASKTPGRTRAINLFQVDEGKYLADLPGYGYAKMPETMAKDLQRLMSRYLTKRRSLKGLILVMDIRHPLKTSDQEVLEHCLHAGLPVHVLLNKRDKLGKGAANKALREVEARLADMPQVTVQLFSARTGEGVEKAWERIELFWKKKSPG